MIFVTIWECLHELFILSRKCLHALIPSKLLFRQKCSQSQSVLSEKSVEEECCSSRVLSGNFTANCALLPSLATHEWQIKNVNVNPPQENNGCA